jgi:hypothetical protein
VGLGHRAQLMFQGRSSFTARLKSAVLVRNLIVALLRTEEVF